MPNANLTCLCRVLYDTTPCVMQAKTGVQIRDVLSEPHGPTQNLETLDFASVLTMIFHSARIRSPSCTDSAVAALSGCAAPPLSSDSTAISARVQCAGTQ